MQFRMAGSTLRPRWRFPAQRPAPTWGITAIRRLLFFLRCSTSAWAGGCSTREDRNSPGRPWGRPASCRSGGHFDNMGLYELVRRRCYRIVICDAEQDEGHTFAGIASAIRKCRIDFGVEITLDLEALRPNKKTGRCKALHVRGTIRYPETPATELGEILYIKSSLT